MCAMLTLSVMLVLFVIGCMRVLAEPVDYTAAQLLRLSNVTLDGFEELMVMEDMGDLEIMTANLNKDVVDILLLNKSVLYAKEELDSINMTYKVLSENIQDQISIEREKTVSNTTNKTCSSGTCFDWNKYYRLDAIYQYLDYLQDKYPDVVTVISVGLSVEGRPIKMVKLSVGSNHTSEKAVWVDGGVHAREWITPAAALYIATEVAAYLHSNFSSDSPPALVYYVLPVLNPDGYEYSHTHDRLWRKNRAINKNSDCIGTDLNRNWGYGWGGRESTANPCSSNYRGAKPFSEPETASVSNFILNSTAKIMGYLSLHSYGQKIIFPWAYTYFRPNDYKELYNLAYKMAYNVNNSTGVKYRYGTAAEIYYVASGGSQDWAKATANIKYSYTMELRDTGKYAFSLPPEEIIQASKDAFAAFTVLSENIKC